MRNSLLFLVVVLAGTALGTRWLAESRHELPAPVVEAPEAIFSHHLQGDELVVTLHNEGSGSLAYKTRGYGAQGQAIHVVLKSLDGGYLAPFWGCGTGLVDGVEELAPGRSISQTFSRGCLVPSGGSVTQMVAELDLVAGGETVTLRTAAIEWLAGKT